MRLLFVGRLERRKNVVGLLRTLLGLDRSDWRLTVIGGDTDSGPLGTSVRDALELLRADDPRVVLRGALPSAEVAEAMREHDVLVAPSRWECWPYVALEALHLGRPVLATPVGGLREMVVPGRSGWLTGSGPDGLEDALREVLDGGREGVDALAGSGGPVARGRELCDPDAIREAYAGVVAAPIRRAVAGGGAGGGRRVRGGGVGGGVPLVSVVVPFFGLGGFVGEAVGSVVGQSWERLEVVLVVDGSFGGVLDGVVGELAGRCSVVVVSQVNQGLGAARNVGVSVSRGRYVVPLDADNVLEPLFVERCVGVLEACPEVGYVTSWSRYVDEGGVPRLGGDVGYEPLGNRAVGVLGEVNVAGDAVAVLRRRLFDVGFRWSEELTSFEDWALYRRLADAGHFGVVIPERLWRYRVREASMQARVAQPNRARLIGEIDAHIAEHQMQWIP